MYGGNVSEKLLQWPEARIRLLWLQGQYINMQLVLEACTSTVELPEAAPEAQHTGVPAG